MLGAPETGRAARAAGNEVRGAGGVSRLVLLRLERDKCAATNKTKTSQQSNAVMYYFLNVQRDSANQYKCSEISWLMLENRRGTEPRCFKILH